jgi:periplasmic protein CpxP/Spy
MKKTFLIIAIALLSVPVLAQNSKGKGKDQEKTQKAKNLTPEEKATKITNRLKTELALTDEQTPKVNQATLSRINQVAAAKTKAGDDKKIFGQERKKIFQSWETEMKGILTADQYKTYLVKKEEKKKKIQENKGKKTGQTNEAIEEDLEEVGE